MKHDHPLHFRLNLKPTSSTIADALMQYYKCSNQGSDCNTLINSNGVDKEILEGFFDVVIFRSQPLPFYRLYTFVSVEPIAE